MTKEQIVELLKARQRAIIVWPTYRQARDEYYKVAPELSNQRTVDFSLIMPQLSIMRDNPEARQSKDQTFIKYTSVGSDPYYARTAQAIIIFPLAIKPQANLHLWQDMQVACEGYRMPGYGG